MDWTKSKVLVTGGTGLLGSHLVQDLVNLGAAVTVIIRDGVPKSLFYELGLQDQVTIVRGNITDFNLVERTLVEYEIDTVFHLAAQTLVGYANKSPVETFKTNIEGSWNILEACRLHKDQIKRVIVASSDKAYGDLKGESYDESYPLAGEHPYDVSKSCTDLLARTYFVTYGLPVAVTRCGNFFGPGDLNFNRIIPQTILSTLEEEPVKLRGDGTNIRDYIYVKDGSHAYLTLAEQMVDGRHSGEAFNFSYNLKLSVNAVVEKVTQLMGRPDLLPVRQEKTKNEIMVQALDSSKARTILNWKPKFGFEEGLRDTIDWYSRYKVRKQ